MSDPGPSYYHLWMGVRRDSSGTNSTTTEQNAPRTGPNGTRRDLTDARNALLRIRRSQVRVLPSAPEKVLQMLRFCSVKSTRRSARTTHLTTYLFPNCLADPVRSDGISRDPDARNLAWVGILWRCAWPHDRSYECNKTTEAVLLGYLRDLLSASNRLAGGLGDLISSVKAAAHSPKSLSSSQSTI